MIARLAITPGEPAGIGPDIVVQLAQKKQPTDLVVFADADLLLARAKSLNLPLSLISYDPEQAPSLLPINTLRISSTPLKTNVIAGKPDKRNAAYVLETLDHATNACVENHCDGLVTGPVHKGLINQAGFHFSGHTEYLAKHTNSEQVVMLLATEGLRVALVTTHIPLKDVSAAITPTLLEKTIRVLHCDLQKYFCNKAPVIFVCGINPHAGDQGALGTEEIDTIIPVLEKLRAQKINVIGPLSADTIFSPDNMAKADAFLAMYHDQGLPILKYKGFSNAINVTLGLNIIRTSVDHGTAFELAGTGKADNHSLQLAVDTAARMIELKKLNSTNTQ